MRAEVTASLCSPEDRPIEFEVDPTRVGVDLSGTPSATLSPLELELPVIAMTVPKLTVSLPTPKLTIGIEPTGVQTIIASLKAVREFLGSLDTPINDPGNLLSSIASGDIIASIGSFVDLSTITQDELLDSMIFATAPALIGLALIQPALALKATAQLELGTMEVELDGNVSIDMGAVRLHGVPVQGNDDPLTASVDLDATGLEAVIDGLRATLKGCVVLNGGEPPPPPDKPPPTVLNVTYEREVNGYLRLAISGQGFGAQQDQGSVELRSSSAVFSPVSYDEWTEHHIEVTFQPDPGLGGYSVVVIGANGKGAAPVPLVVK